MFTHDSFSLRRLAAAMQDALAGDGFYAFLEQQAEGSSLGRHEALVRYMEYSLAEARDHEHGILQLLEGGAVGASVWLKPMERDVAEQASAAKSAFLTEHLGRRCAEAYEQAVDFMEQQAYEAVALDSWYLSILAVAPEAQGRGVGRLLMTPVLEQSDASGIATYLETFTPRNESFYRRLGYQMARRRLEPTSGKEYALMVRQPGAPGPE